MDYLLLMDQFVARQSGPRRSSQRLLHECLREAIRQGVLANGTRLLASRALAQELGVARNLVLYAYEQLATEELVRSDRKGTVVTYLPPSKPTGAARVATPAGLSRMGRSLATLPLAADVAGGFAPGVPALSEFPVNLWRRLIDRAWRSMSAAKSGWQLNYGPAAGEPLLREAVAAHLRASRGAVCSADQIFITDGTQASLDLCARAFADAGDTAWLEDPGYGGAITAFRAAHLKIHGIATDAQGLHSQASDWHKHRPRLIYVTPSHQYPSGAVMSLARRIALIDQAQRAGALIIEDDYDSEFRHDGPPLVAMQGLTPDAPVLYLGTFSKTMFPALRIGFVLVPAGLAAPLSAMLARSSPRGRAADQLALAEFLRDGHFGLHLRRMRRLYRQRRDALTTALQAQLGDLASVQGESAGMHLALVFHSPDIDDNAISIQALQQGIVAPSLSQHAVGKRRPAHRGLVLGYAQVPVDTIEPLVLRLAAVVRQALRAAPKTLR